LAYLANEKTANWFREFQLRDEASTHAGNRESAGLDEPESPLIPSRNLELAFAKKATADAEGPRSRQGQGYRAIPDRQLPEGIKSCGQHGSSRELEPKAVQRLSNEGIRGP
jgi:hypothetical protein